jgi:hypothetical protein
MMFCGSIFNLFSIDSVPPPYDVNEKTQPDVNPIVDHEPPPYPIAISLTLRHTEENTHGGRNDPKDLVQLTFYAENQQEPDVHPTALSDDPQPDSRSQLPIHFIGPPSSPPTSIKPQQYLQLPHPTPSPFEDSPPPEVNFLYRPLLPPACRPLVSPVQGCPPMSSFLSPPSLPGGPGHGIRPPPNIPGVLPPAPFFGPPKNPTLIIPPGTPTDFRLLVRQQPERAKMCGFGDKDRRPIDPPPVVELIKNNGLVSSTQNQTLLLQCTLWNEEGTEHRNIIRATPGATAGLGSEEDLPVQPEEKYARAVMGKIFATAVPLKDEHGKHGFLYIFPDLSIRVEGRYRLKFDLLRVVVPPGSPVLGTNHVAAEVLSDVFVVYAAKEFPGMMQSTELTKAIARQGIKIAVRGEPQSRRSSTTSRKPSARLSTLEEDEATNPVFQKENVDELSRQDDNSVELLSSTTSSKLGGKDFLLTEKAD